MQAGRALTELAEATGDAHRFFFYTSPYRRSIETYRSMVAEVPKERITGALPAPFSRWPRRIVAARLGASIWSAAGCNVIAGLVQMRVLLKALMSRPVLVCRVRAQEEVLSLQAGSWCM